MFLSVQQDSYETEQRNTDKMYVHIVCHIMSNTPMGLFGTKSGKFIYFFYINQTEALKNITTFPNLYKKSAGC
jgi:hypothetical protein